MGLVQSNKQVGDQIYVLRVEGSFEGEMGQFYMVRAWGQYPLLSRPLSLFQLGDGFIEFLYHVVGEGTALLSRLRKGDKVQVQGPFGNGFPKAQGRTALIGGGMGIAPLFACAQNIPDAYVYLGFSLTPVMVDQFTKLTTALHINVGGYIVNDVNFNDYDTIFACGPLAMLQAVQYKQAQMEGDARVFISVENRMACGIGACLVCSIECKDKRRKVCTDGPVFAAEEVILHG